LDTSTTVIWEFLSGQKFKFTAIIPVHFGRNNSTASRFAKFATGVSTNRKTAWIRPQPGHNRQTEPLGIRHHTMNASLI